MAITFTYSGEGRVFIKPSLDAFFLSGPPFVSIHKKTHHDRSFRETSLTYILAPVNTGKFEIGKASIRINNKTYYSDPIALDVCPNQCYFLEGHEADGKPLNFPMNYEYNSKKSKFKLSGSNPGHTLLIPRSKIAAAFHAIGTTMKWTFMLAGAIYLPKYLDFNMIIGAAAGSFIGGVNCQIMYKLVGMKSKYKYAQKFPLVREYTEKGYQCGSSTGTPVLGSNILYKFARLII